MPTRVFAAGSLRKVLPAMAKESGLQLDFEFGPSGVLKERILNGEKPDMFFPASMRHATELHDAGEYLCPTVFLQNSLCLFGKKAFLVGDDVLEMLMNPHCRLGTSTPHDDPGGDYAFSVFDKAESLRPGAGALLKAKALTLVGGRNSEIKEGAKSPVHVLFDTDLVDAFLGYRTTALDVVSRRSGLAVEDLPPSLAVKAEYAATVLDGSNQGERALAALSCQEATDILVAHGFSKQVHRP